MTDREVEAWGDADLWPGGPSLLTDSMVVSTAEARGSRKLAKRRRRPADRSTSPTPHIPQCSRRRSEPYASLTQNTARIYTDACPGPVRHQVRGPPRHAAMGQPAQLQGLPEQIRPQVSIVTHHSDRRLRIHILIRLASSYKIGKNFHGIDLHRARIFGTTAAGFGAVAGIFALFFFADIPRVRKDIMQKIPILGDHFVREIAPEDNPF
ncbi:hypothetical protein E4T43_06212 [Aureobasidium subglaciale]|nr:hypothetical protein E4T43_06212 [Aureobasidium subglaciale]